MSWNGLPLVPLSVQVLAPASKVVVSPAVSVPLPTCKSVWTVTPPLPPLLVVIVRGVPLPLELLNIRVPNAQAFEPEVVPNVLSAATLCSKVRSELDVTRAEPVTLPLAVPLADKVTLVSEKSVSFVTANVDEIIPLPLLLKERL